MGLLGESYDVAVRALRRLSPLVRGSSKVAQGARGRERAREVLAAWAGAHRDPRRPLVWVHAASVGEGLQAKAVLQELRALRSDLQIVYTFFSPSAVASARSVPADVSAYLPWDVRSELARLLAIVRPSLIAFTQKEVWPGLTAAATGAGIPVVLFAGTLAEAARRRGPLARRVLRPTFASLAKVLAVAPEDGGRFRDLGVPSDRIEVTGDPGLDSAWERLRTADPRASYLAPFVDHPVPILVAGSTWPSDEAVLIPALAALRSGGTALTAILAPHEPHEEHLAALERALVGAGVPSLRLAQAERRSAVESGSAVILDRTGVLAHLYSVGSVAFVGGGFHGKGLHSVIEPAAAGLPVLFGPEHASSRGALDLLAAGGAETVREVAELASILQAWTLDHERGADIGARAKGYVERHLGAARRTAEALASYLSAHEVSPNGS